MTQVNEKNLRTALVVGAEKFLNRGKLQTALLSLGLDNKFTFFYYSANRKKAMEVKGLASNSETSFQELILLAKDVVSAYKYGLLGSDICDSIVSGGVFDSDEFGQQKKVIEEQQRNAGPMNTSNEWENEETVRNLLGKDCFKSSMVCKKN